MDIPAQSCPGVWVIPTNILLLSQKQEGGGLSFWSACFHHIPPLIDPYPLSPFQADTTSSAFLGGGGLSPRCGDTCRWGTPMCRDNLHGVPVLQLLTPFTKGRPQNHFIASWVSTTPSRDRF